MDWSREAFTMNEDLSLAVKKVFIKLYDEGLIYRGERLVNWDTVLQTALSDLEVMSEEHQGSLWYLKYPLDDKNFITVATTRPETMLGDTAIAVNPKDDRYNSLIGKKITLPLTGREVPVVGDDYVDSEYELGKKYSLHEVDGQVKSSDVDSDFEPINIFNDDAWTNDNVPAPFGNLDRFKVRKLVVEKLTELSLLEKEEKHHISVPRGERSNVVIEPKLSHQWYVKTSEMAARANEAVNNGEVKFHPQNWDKTYFNWMDNIQDWCISRQIWWGHRIPAWYDAEGNVYVGHNEEEKQETLT